ncbi:ABC-type uncharacterized transport system substrate-binding protein [Bradyrhizobium sp. AZCC 2289]
MKRREFIGLIGGVLTASNSSQRVEAQQFNKVPLLGVLVAEAAPHSFPDAFQAGLQSLGYSVGRNIEIEWLYADGLYSRAVEKAKELVKLGVNIIVAHHTPAVKAAMTATTTIPIVMSPAGAPLETGLVGSLSRPGGNVTGLSSMEAELGSKRLNLLRDAIPGLKNVAVLASRSDPFTRPYLADVQSAATRAALTLHPAMVDGPNDFEAAFANISAASSDDPATVRVIHITNRSTCSQASPAHHFELSRYHARRRLYLLFGRSCRLFSTGGDLRGQDSQGCQTRRFARRTTDKIRIRCQPQGRKSAWPRYTRRYLA